MKASELQLFLKKDVTKFCRYLLSNGKVDGNYYTVGNVDNDKGKSLKVVLHGERAGYYCDFAGKEKGDLINLCMEVKKCNFVEACKIIKSFLGIKSDDKFFDKAKKRNYKRFTGKIDNSGIIALPVANYLQDDRNFSDYIIKKFMVYSTISKSGIEYINFPYIVDNEVFMIKSLAVKRIDGKKVIYSTKDSEPCLFGWHACDVDNSRDIILTEGEFDAMSYRQIGYNALSMPFGAGNFDWLEFEYERISSYDNIFISFDNDDAGKKATSAIIKRLGYDKVRIIDLELKDANEYLQKNMLTELEDCILTARYVNPSELKNSMEFKGDTWDFVSDNVIVNGTKMSLAGSAGLVFLDDEVSLWTGINGHGKSLVLGQILLDIVGQNKKVCIASLEVRPAVTLGRMARQTCGKRHPEKHEFDKCFEWFDNNVFIFDFMGETSYKKLLKIFAYAFKRYGVTQFLIDSLMLLDVPEDDRDLQKKFIQDVCEFARNYNVHVHVVAHPRKVKSEYEMPSKMDISGSGMLTNAVENVFVVWRNKEKEMIIDKSKFSSSTIEDIEKAKAYKHQPDSIIHVCKNRNGSFEGAIPLWFCPPSMQFINSPTDKPENYLKKYCGLSIPEDCLED